MIIRLRRTREHWMSGITDKNKTVLVPCGDWPSGYQLPELNVSGFPKKSIVRILKIFNFQFKTHLMIACKAGAKCFFEYSSGIFGSTIALKSINPRGQ